MRAVARAGDGEVMGIRKRRQGSHALGFGALVTHVERVNAQCNHNSAVTRLGVQNLSVLTRAHKK
ncbi:MAG: hypothetical protein ACI9U2_004679 [Bradymonadia bacterium]|jgi:hypothetical protein